MIVLGSVLPFVAIGALTCIIVICVKMKHQRRRNRWKMQKASKIKQGSKVKRSYRKPQATHELSEKSRKSGTRKSGTSQVPNFSPPGSYNGSIDLHDVLPQKKLSQPEPSSSYLLFSEQLKEERPRFASYTRVANKGRNLKGTALYKVPSNVKKYGPPKHPPPFSSHRGVNERARRSARFEINVHEYALPSPTSDGEDTNEYSNIGKIHLKFLIKVLFEMCMTFLYSIAVYYIYVCLNNRY